MKRHQPRPRLVNPVALAIELASKLDSTEQATLKAIIGDAFARLRRGEHPAAQWRILADALNVAEQLALIGICSDAASRERIDAGQAALAAVHLTLWRSRLGGKEEPETRPAWGWMEQPLVDIEMALAGLHSALRDRQFNGMNRQFFGNDSRRLPEKAMPNLPLRPGSEAPNV